MVGCLELFDLFGRVVIDDQFERPNDSPWPIFCGGVASGRRAAIALGCQLTEMVDVMEHVLEPAHGIGPVVTDGAPWQANTVVGDDVDTSLLPIPVHSRGDGGAFITGAVTVARDPISGRGNLGYNRMLRIDRTHFGFNVNEWRDVGTFWKSREDPDAPFPVVLAIGLDPAVMIAAGVKTPVDELFIAGTIRVALRLRGRLPLRCATRFCFRRAFLALRGIRCCIAGILRFISWCRGFVYRFLQSRQILGQRLWINLLCFRGCRLTRLYVKGPTRLGCAAGNPGC